MMDSTLDIEGTATGGSETPEPAVGGRCSPQVSSSPVSTKSVVVLRQAATASNGAGNTTAGEGAKQALPSGQKATEATVPASSASQSRLQAEARYTKLLEDTIAQLESLEAAVRAAPNTKLDVKTGVRAVGAGLREFANLAKSLGLARNPDAQEQRIKRLQLQQQQQHAQTTKALKDIQEGMRQRGFGGGATDLSVEELGARTSDVHARLAEQNEKIDAITEFMASLDTKSHQEVPNDRWSEVVGRRKPPKKAGPPLAISRATGIPIAIGTDGAPKPTLSAPKPSKRSRPPAILVNVKREDFPVLAKKIRGGADHKIIGDRVTGMRQANSGGLLIEVRGDPSDVEAVRAEVSRLAGDEIEVRSLQQRTTLEIRDLDEWSTKEEVTSSLLASYGTEGEMFRVVSLRRQHGGSQVAVVTAPKAIAQKALSTGRLRVGMVSCRIRLREGKARCFRCLSYGHMSKACKGKDRSGCCWRCGTSGHLAAHCSAERETIISFQKTLEAGTDREEPHRNDEAVGSDQNQK